MSKYRVKLLNFATVIGPEGVINLKNVHKWAGIALLTSPAAGCWHRDHFLLVAMSDHKIGSRNIKPEVVFKVQKMAQYA